jgi:RHS repeat-associated protein
VTGLDYAINRYYASQWGRFLSSDPYAGSVAPGNPQSWNRYLYVDGDPANLTDLSGLMDGPPGDPGSPGGPGGGPGSGFGWGGSGGGFGDGGGCNYLPNPGNWYDAGGGSFWPFGGNPPWCAQPFLPAGGAFGGGGGSNICNSKILQPSFLNIFAGMGTALGINPEFLMALSLEESGANLSHVFQKNSSSGGQPLNNLFGVAPGGGNNMAFSSPQASANWWVSTFGGALKNQPTTIQGFVSDLLNNPAGPYNSANPNWAVSIEGGTWVKTAGGVVAGQPTIGTYQSILNWMNKCNIKMPGN